MYRYVGRTMTTQEIDSIDKMLFDNIAIRQAITIQQNKQHTAQHIQEVYYA